MPIGTDLVLHEKKDAAAILLDGERLGRVVEEAARRYGTPLAIPQMDLQVEKASLLAALGLPEADVPTYHFAQCPDPQQIAVLEEGLRGPLSPRMEANVGAVSYIATRTDLVPVGMSIGPFSLATKLLADPITPVFLAGSGATAEDDPEVKALECALDLALKTVLRSLKAQIEAGAKAVMVAEPAANQVYFSPKQMEKGSPIFRRYALEPNLQIRKMVGDAGVDLLFHCCGELTDSMLAAFTELQPKLLSLGSSRKLWQDAAIVPKDIVLYGNLPSKRFYSDDLISVDEVASTADELVAKMRQVGHPFILGSECDVLSVPGCDETIRQKVQAFVGRRG
jgi:uroporphyrinogen-III decarboxylase